ncbi:MAG: adaptor protein MecA [Eubacteriales bacterium]|nr:adaptor protein MecA [Eubacteriales bacterium]
MKIERLSENQIRCTLNKADLASRQLKISELAYGSEKAKELFRDMMQQASHELGFEADDIPLMIEAIPISSECIVLIVTKVDDPEELDTRFSKFSPSSMDDEYDDYPYSDDMEVIESDSYSPPTARDELDDDTNKDNPLPDNNSVQSGEYDSNDLVNLFSKVKDYLNQSITDTDSNNTEKTKQPVSHLPQGQPVIRVFSFDSLDFVSSAAKAVYPVYSDYNSLFKNQRENKYYLVLKRTSCPAVNFNKTCNILSEFGSRTSSNTNSLNYFKEHSECIIEKHAIQVLARI